MSAVRTALRWAPACRSRHRHTCGRRGDPSSPCARRVSVVLVCGRVLLCCCVHARGGCRTAHRQGHARAGEQAHEAGSLPIHQIGNEHCTGRGDECRAASQKREPLVPAALSPPPPVPAQLPPSSSSPARRAPDDHEADQNRQGDSTDDADDDQSDGPAGQGAVGDAVRVGVTAVVLAVQAEEVLAAQRGGKGGAGRRAVE